MSTITQPRAENRAAEAVGRVRPVVSVVVVNYNGGSLVVEAVRAVLISTVSVELLISDNASTDGSRELLRELFSSDQRLRLIENRNNLGFARACNLLLAQARGEYLLVLNPDALIEPDTLERLVKVLQARPDAAMVGCLIRNIDGSEQAGCRRAVPTPWRSLVRVLNLRRLFPHYSRFRDFVLTREPLPSGPVPVEAISGAFMLLRHEVIDRVGVFDDAYFMHCEDLDWCMRVRRAGWQILFVPNVEVVHYRGMCSKDRPIFVLWHKHKGMIRFYRKFFRHQYPWPLMILVMVAVWTRFMLLAGLTLFLPQKSRDPAGENQEQVAIVRTVAQRKRITQLGAKPDTDSAEVDPMLVVSSTDAERPYRRSS